MPKKKQVTFQNNIQGKFIPRDDPPSATGPRSGTLDHRYNSKMVELLSNSSKTTTIENEKSSSNRSKNSSETSTNSTSETTSVDSTRIPSRTFHRRIVTALESWRRRSTSSANVTSPTISPSRSPSRSQVKSQPITFGQLKKASGVHQQNENFSSTTIESNDSSISSTVQSNIDLIISEQQEKQSAPNGQTARSEQNSFLLNSMKISTNDSERSSFPPIIDNSIEHSSIVPRIKPDEETNQNKTPISVDQILSSYYSKMQLQNSNQIVSSTPYPMNNLPNYLQTSPTTIIWNNSSTNQISPSNGQFLLNEQSRNRPPPPSYSSSVANGHRSTLPPTVNPVQYLIRPPVPPVVLEQFYPNNNNFSLNSTAINNLSVRAPPPRYEPSTVETSKASSSSNQNEEKPVEVTAKAPGFDREFSRLLYGKDSARTRHQRQKRKALSDPVKKSVEEAGRSAEKIHRRLTAHLNRRDTVKEEEETTSDSYEIEKHENKSFLSRRLTRPSSRHLNYRHSSRNAIVPANPVLSKPIPQFLRVYSQAPSSNDILLQWQLFSLSELESFEAMMTKLYKDENLSCVQSYESYRSALASVLTTKNFVSQFETEDEDDSITTTAL